MIPPPTQPVTGEPPTGSPVPLSDPSRAQLLLHRSALVLLCTVLALWAAASLQWPYYWDHGIFAWIGDTALHGGMPYRDAWDVKGPLTFYLFALVEAVFGKGMWGIRLFDLLVLATGMAGAARLVGTMAGRGAGMYTALFIALQYAGSDFNNTAQPDGWAALLILPGLVPLVTDRRMMVPHRAAAAAALIGALTLLKPVFAAWLVAPFLYVVLAPDKQAGTKLRALVGMGASFLLPLALCAAWFAVRGALGALVDAYLLFNLDQAGTQPIPVREALRRFAWRLILSPTIMLGSAAALAGALGLLVWRRRMGAIIVAWAAAGFIMVYVQHRFYSRYHWHVAYVPFAVLAGVALGSLWRERVGDERRWSTPRVLAAVTGLLLFLTVLEPPLRLVGRWISFETGRISREQYDGDFRDEVLYWSAATSRRLADWMAGHTRPGEPVFVWSDPMVNYLSGGPPSAGSPSTSRSTRSPRPRAARRTGQSCCKGSRRSVLPISPSAAAAWRSPIR